MPHGFHEMAAKALKCFQHVEECCPEILKLCLIRPLSDVSCLAQVFFQNGESNFARSLIDMGNSCLYKCPVFSGRVDLWNRD